MDYQELYSSESYGNRLYCGIKISIASPVEDKRKLSRALREAGKLIEDAVTREFNATDKETQDAVESDRIGILSCFPDRIYVKEIPNGYCGDACCEHEPWFEVTTTVGVIRIGWRKRVLNIDWSQSDVTVMADVLFPSEDVTKFDRTIHAWGYEKATEYIATILQQPTEEGKRGE